jgi:hypothetical protein
MNFSAGKTVRHIGHQSGVSRTIMVLCAHQEGGTDPCGAKGAIRLQLCDYEAGPVGAENQDSRESEYGNNERIPIP